MTTKTYTSKQLELKHKQGLSKNDCQAIYRKTSLGEDIYEDYDFEIDFSDATEITDEQVENGIVMPAVKDFTTKTLLDNLTDGNYIIPTNNRVDFILNGQRTQYSNVELLLSVQDDGRTLKVFVDNETQRKD